MKNFKRILSVFLVIAMVAISFTGCAGKGWNNTIIEGNIEKKMALQIHYDGSFRILQFTDTHLVGNGKTKIDDQTLRWMKEAVEQAKPDLVELTGDITGGSTEGRNDGIIAIANMFEKMGQYWRTTLVTTMANGQKKVAKRIFG